eukprot:TRINITY_DN1329_c0_g1_i1.p1 TRINITY_DN1329_c0_g1~~TRINITY_DN1329_c0_g1_i1.p1  ORF type:complete len:855 (-),score=180.21 TRINITY_DN1329_c0_g1_i1:83-2575(-)
MDYGDGKLDGVYQFNTQHRRTECCEEINEALADKKANNRYSNTKYVEKAECISSYDHKCGNGVIEPPEVCDGGKCCDQTTCKPIASAQCFTANTECCDDNCQFKTTASLCTYSGSPNAGYCNNGKCERGICSRFNWESCGTIVCSQSCTVSNTCNNLQYYTFTISGTKISGTEAARVVDGALCSAQGGTCKQGVCTQVDSTTYSWNALSWGDCDVTTCVTSGQNAVQTRQVECRSDNNQITSQDKCDSNSKPSMTRSCNPAPPACPTYSWKYQAPSKCSHDCRQSNGPIPTQTATAYCQDSNGKTVNNLLCSANGGQPKVTNCNNQACVLKWVTGNWNTCSKVCGTGTQTRPVDCHEIQTLEGLEVVVNDNVCASSMSKPKSSRNCNEDACLEYAYVTGSWSACNQTCGGGSQTRNVDCVEIKSQTTQSDDTKCQGSKPLSTQTCNNEICPIYKWDSSDAWSPACPSCGTGPNHKQTRLVICRHTNALTDKNEVEEYFCTNSKPISEKPCSSTDVCPVYEWQFDSWGDCSASSCSKQGVSTRNVDCYNVAKMPQSQVSNDLCTEKKPITSTACTGACTDADNKWVAEPWDISKCTKKCGLGTMSRKVSCQGPDGNAATKCLGTKPASESGCNAFACPNWVVGMWEQCSVPCGDGIQNRPNPKCTNHLGEMVDQSECKASMPSTQQPCNIQPCAHWHREPWSFCNKACSSGSSVGKQYRQITCRMPHDSYYLGRSANEAFCPPRNEAPANEQDCNVEVCGDFYWDVDASGWGKCNQTCGPYGQQKATIVCHDLNNGNAIVDDKKCVSGKPLGPTCNEASCPVAQWQNRQMV